MSHSKQEADVEEYQCVKDQMIELNKEIDKLKIAIIDINDKYDNDILFVNLMICYQRLKKRIDYVLKEHF